MLRLFRRPSYYNIRRKYVVLLAVLVSLSVLTLALRGAIPDKTYAYREIAASSVQGLALSYRAQGEGWSVDAKNIVPETPFFSGEDRFQAVILRLPHEYVPAGSWMVRWVSVTYELTSDSVAQYEMFLVSRNATGAFLVNAQGPVFLSHSEVSKDIYRLDATTVPLTPLSEEFKLVGPLLDDFSILIAKKNPESGGFSFFRLEDSIELMSSNVDTRSRPVLDLQQITVFSIGAGVSIMIIPGLLLTAQALRLQRPSKGPPTIFWGILFSYGVVVRLVLAPFTGHPYDMEVWTQSARLYYESGLIGIRLFPLPFWYYVLLLAYSPYALLRILGFRDATFLGHISGMAESVFIKAPLMFSDLLAFYILVKICKRIDTAEGDSWKCKAFAVMYFLNPLAIYMSSVWGIYDGIAVALFLAGLYFGLLRERPVLSGLSFVASGLAKGFGFLGLVPLFVNPMRGKRISNILAIAGMTIAISTLLYLPVIATSTVRELPGIFLEFFRGRAGFGSSTSYVAGASFMSYLSVMGLNIQPAYLTYTLIALTVVLSILYAKQARDSLGQARLELTLRYFAAVFLVSYLVFFRVYEQYYLWVIPILIIYSFVTDATAPLLVALSLGIILIPPLLGTLIAGTAYYYGVPGNLPVDMAMLTVLASSLVVCGLISLADLKGRLAILKTDRGMAALAGPALWFSFTLAFYTYYRVPFLGAAWYPISLVIALTAATFFKWKSMRRNT